MDTTRAVGASIFTASLVLSVFLTPEHVQQTIYGQINQIHDVIHDKFIRNSSSTNALIVETLQGADSHNNPKLLKELQGEILQKNKQIESLSKKLEEDKKQREEELSVVVRRADKLKEENARLLDTLRRASSGSKEPFVVSEPLPLWQYLLNIVAVALTIYVGYLKFSERRSKQSTGALTAMPPYVQPEREAFEAPKIERVEHNAEVASARPQNVSIAELIPSENQEAGQSEKLEEVPIQDFTDAVSNEPSVAGTALVEEERLPAQEEAPAAQEEDPPAPPTPSKVSIVFEEYPPDSSEAIDMNGNVIDELLNEESNPLEQSFINLEQFEIARKSMQTK